MSDDRISRLPQQNPCGIPKWEPQVLSSNGPRTRKAKQSDFRSGGAVAMVTPGFFRLLSVACLAAALLIAVACKGEHSAARVRVGVLLATSGPADFIGKPERQVLEALLEDYRKHTQSDPGIELLFRDTGGRLESALALFKFFAEDQSIVAIIGPSTSGESIALAVEAERAQIPLLSLAASQQIVLDDNGATRSWVFKFAQNDDLAADRLARAMVANSHTSVALFYSDDGFGKSGANVFRKAVERAGVLRLVHDVAFPSGLSQPGPLVASLPPNAEAVLIWGTAPGPALLVQELRRRHHRAQIYLSHGNASEDFIRSAGPCGTQEFHPARQLPAIHSM
jgi:branched-chain amino acid transport system substrate-binding protein